MGAHTYGRTLLSKEEYHDIGIRVLKAANGEQIGKSEIYESKASRESGILAVKRVAHAAPIEDTT